MESLTPDRIPAGSLCVIDTNILIYAEQGASRQSVDLLRRVESLEIKAVLPQPVWQETMHRLMIAEAFMLGKIRGSNPAKQLANQPEVIRSLSIYRDKIMALIAMGFGFEPCVEADLLEHAMQLQERHGLLTNDSLIAAITLRIGADALVSADAKFKGIDGLVLYSPNDIDIKPR
jgi:predicted nucleic acid-binding protein